MEMIWWLLGAVAVAGMYVLGSTWYVFALRGKLRYNGVGEYIRKGWPMFSPLNCWLYLFTQKRARTNIMDLEQFPELQPIQDNWETIREEALALFEQGTFDQTNANGSQGSYDLGFRTFFKYGWSKFYLRWYGYTHESARELCPKTVEILKDITCVNGAMFSILPGNSQLTRHLDPVACSLRYHLGLSTPNSDDCYIDVDGDTYAWRDGQALLFDETMLHHVKNKVDHHRLILMCDVERPMSFPGKVVNFFSRQLLRMSVVPNREGDRRGFANWMFGTLSPILAKTKALKKTNRPLYLLVKWTVNLSLIALAIALFGGVVLAIYWLIQQLAAGAA